MKIRVPSSCDLALEPQLGSLLLLELAAVVADNALRAHHVQIEGDYSHHESDAATAARAVTRQCDLLLLSVRAYRRLVRARLDRDQADWPDWAE